LTDNQHVAGIRIYKCVRRNLEAKGGVSLAFLIAKRRRNWIVICRRAPQSSSASVIVVPSAKLNVTGH
jgi:hypothetical protein